MNDTQLQKFRINVEREEGDWRKIATILQTSEGGFSVLPSFNGSKKGIIQKNKVEERGWRPHKPEDIILESSDRVKLSIHVDGFAHFSGEKPFKIRSGRFKGTDTPKGIGLLGRPFHKYFPFGVKVFTLVVWGLDAYEVANFSKQNIKFSISDINKYLEFHDREALKKHPTISYKDGFMLNGYMFTDKNIEKDFKNTIDGKNSAKIFEDREIVTNTVKMVSLRNSPDTILGVTVNRGSFGYRELSGYDMTGHSIDNFVIHALYPKPSIATTRGTIDYVKEDI